MPITEYMDNERIKNLKNSMLHNLDCEFFAMFGKVRRLTSFDFFVDELYYKKGLFKKKHKKLYILYLILKNTSESQVINLGFSKDSDDELRSYYGYYGYYGYCREEIMIYFQGIIAGYQKCTQNVGGQLGIKLI